jgi:hypothetical protein
MMGRARAAHLISGRLAGDEADQAEDFSRYHPGPDFSEAKRVPGMAGDLNIRAFSRRFDGWKKSSGWQIGECRAVPLAGPTDEQGRADETGDVNRDCGAPEYAVSSVSSAAAPPGRTIRIPAREQAARDEPVERAGGRQQHAHKRKSGAEALRPFREAAMREEDRPRQDDADGRKDEPHSCQPNPGRNPPD